ncbi:MAG: TraX family protein [Alphaproteobacteria bacterium]
MIKKRHKVKTLNNYNLKIIATFSMLVDHIAKIILVPWLYLKISPINHNFDLYKKLFEIDFAQFGRISMPIFAFLLTEGFKHTKNFKKYLLTMIFMAFLSEPIYDISIHFLRGKIDETYPFYFQAQNILFSFSLGLMMMWGLKKIKNKYTNQYISIFLSLALISTCALISHYLKFDYGWYIILIIACFYILSFNKYLQALSFITLYIIYNQTFPSIFIFITCILILLYNGQKGKLNSKYFFYIFYPAHLLILHIIALLSIYKNSLELFF